MLLLLVFGSRVTVMVDYLVTFWGNQTKPLDRFRTSVRHTQAYVQPSSLIQTLHGGLRHFIFICV